ncbi:hypothetical protein KDA_39950 [Dictyobacter alpinus]|uniref:Carrier domain-containing protein n=1 Tax=Dictyobacter alpinus TaxID=2014873 RepID=A0A402BAR6_9CHLR|nr:non-ribosomal peptide synthetase [Dictyobacter alpinus]GCE28511.1 hypothetical protein KDA_39950 [Dictyobacter alpinus]
MSSTGLQGAHLSLQQTRLQALIHEQPYYRVQCALALTGTIQPTILQQALQDVVQRNEILRTTFTTVAGMDIPLQIIQASGRFDCPLQVLPQDSAARHEQLIEQYFQQLWDEPFQRENGPLIRANLLQQSSERHVLLLSLDALCADSATLRIFMEEVLAHYEMAAQGRSDEPQQEEQLQYVDISAWQDEQRASEEGQAQARFWSTTDTDIATARRMPLPLILDSCDPSAGLRQFAPQQHHTPLTLKAEDLTRIQHIIQRQRASSETFMLTCWQLLLARLTNQYASRVGVTCNGRMYEELATAIGPYTRLLPLYTAFTEEMTFEQLLAQVDYTHQEVYANQLYFDWPSSELERQDMPYMPISYEFVDWNMRNSPSSMRCTIQHSRTVIEPFALKLTVIESEQLLQLQFSYNAYHYTAETIDALRSCLEVLLQGILASPQKTCQAFPLLTESAQQGIIQMGTGVRCPLPALTLAQQFEQQARLYPSAIAVRCGDETRTYEQLNSEANQVARLLRQLGIGPNIAVGIYMERSVTALVGLLAILKAGGVYVPLDTEHPMERLAYQLQQLDARILLTQQKFSDHLTAIGCDMLALDTDPRIAQAEHANLDNITGLEDLAYIIYTSGSTGVPKGIMVRHRGVVNYTQAMSSVIADTAGRHFATVSTLAADLGNTAIFCSLASGGCLHILPYEIITSANAFAKYNAHHPIDILKIVPGHLSALLASPEVGQGCLPRRYLVLGGELLPPALMKQLEQVGYQGTIINHYGPTEATIGCIINIVSHEAVRQMADSTQRSIPIGQPIANTEAYILNSALQIQPRGVIGELYLGGAGLAAGYLQQPEQTASCFLAHPFKQGSNTYLYKSGDLARWIENDQIEYIGRADTQIKIRGFRVEISEIESVLLRHEKVRDCAIIWRNRAGRGAELVAYLTLHKGSLPTAEEIQHFLARYLPVYMLPTAFIILRSLPLTGNGKLDRTFLAAAQETEIQQRFGGSELTQEHTRQAQVPARDEIELQLWQIWEDMLARAPTSISDNFFDLGGHSILAVKLISRIYKQFGRELDLTALFQHPTLAELAMIVRQQTDAYNQRSILVPLNTQGALPPFFCIHPAGGNVLCYRDLAHHLGPEQPFFALQAPFFANDDDYSQLPTLATHYLTAIQTVHPHGPYRLGGWSLGGVIAFEIAHQLQQKGEEVAVLALIDSSAPDTQPQPEQIAARPDTSDAGLVKEILQTQPAINREEQERLAALPDEEQLLFICERLQQLQIIPADVDLALYRKFAIINLLLKYAANTYRATPIAQKIILFRAEDDLASIQNVATLTHEQMTQGWEKLTEEEISVHLVAGTHMDLVYEPAVQQLSSILRTYLTTLILQ